MDLVNRSLIKNWHNHKARHLKTIVLRKMGLSEQAEKLIDESLKIDKFNFGVIFEKYLLSGNEDVLREFQDILRDNAHNYIEFSLDYANAGQFDEAISLLAFHQKGKKEMYPMVCYFQAWYNEQKGDIQEAKKLYSMAQAMPKDYCFPNRIEETIVLRAAINCNPTDANALYYLGNYWYAAKQYEDAQSCWEASIKLDDTNAICHRNLALLYFNKTGDKNLAKEHLEKAFNLDYTDARLLMELDQLYKKLNLPFDIRLELLEANIELTESRDDLFLEYIALHNFKGEHQKALELIQKRTFHPWEGGEGKVPFQYVTANIEVAKQYIEDGQLTQAISHLEQAKSYPPNLGEGKLYGTQENDIDYWLGCAYSLLGDKNKANQYWETASVGLSTPSPALFYNDQQPDKIFYQGLALLKLGKQEEANLRFYNLISYGKTHMNDNVKLDYFAISLPDLLIWEENLNTRNKIHCEFLIGLGKLGLSVLEEASIAFGEAMKRDSYHLPVVIHSKMVLNTASQLENA